MARARNIKPSFFKNEILGQEDPLISILFISLWSIADREGRLEDRPLRIKAETFPYREIAAPLFNGYLTVLARHGFIERYKVGELSIIQIVNFRKHQAPHNTEKPSELPERPIDSPITVKAPLDNDDLTQAKRPDSLFIDSLIPSSLIPDSPNMIPSGDGAEKSAPAPKTEIAKSAKPETDLQTSCRETWKSYSDAYFIRYETEPVRNATVNTQVKAFVKRIGVDESPHVAAFFVQSNAAFYVQRGHTFGNLLADAEKLRTEWATGRTMTGTRARQIDQSQANFSVVDEAMKILEAQKNAKTA